MVYFFTKSMNYYYDAESIKTPSKNAVDNRSSNRKRMPNVLENGMRKSGVYEKANKRDVWTMATAKFKGAHTAVMPNELAETCIKAGSKERGIILDPFLGVGTTALCALKLNRMFTGIELNPTYATIARKRIDELLEKNNQQQLII
jgi:DNA modification methylase